jgi:TolA-binding protein
MTEMITIIAVGVGLAGLILNGQKNAREDTKSLEARLREEMNARFDQMDARLDQMDTRLDQMEVRFERLEARMGTMERQQAKLEGLLEGLREAISGRAPTSR